MTSKVYSAILSTVLCWCRHREHAVSVWFISIWKGVQKVCVLLVLSVMMSVWAGQK